MTYDVYKLGTVCYKPVFDHDNKLDTVCHKPVCDYDNKTGTVSQTYM